MQRYTYLATCRDLFDLPQREGGGPPLPIAVRCHSRHEAEKVFAVQRDLQELDPTNKDEVRRAIQMSEVARSLFGGKGKAQYGTEFFAVSRSHLPFPCIFLTW